MAINDVRICVTANITVTDEMAERCLRLLEIWQDDNTDKKIIGEVSNGRTVFRIVTREGFADEAAGKNATITAKNCTYGTAMEDSFEFPKGQKLLEKRGK